MIHLPLCLALLAIPQTGEWVRYDVSVLMQPTWRAPEFTAMANAYQIGEQDGLSLGESDPDQDPSAALELFSMLFQGSGIEVDWDSVGEQPPSIRVFADSNDHMAIRGLLDLLDKTLSQSIRVEVAWLDKIPQGAAEAAGWVEDSQAQGWIDGARTEGDLRGTWSVDPTVGGIAGFESQRPSALRAGAATEIATRSFALHPKIATARSGVDLLAQCLPVSGGTRVGLVFEHRQATGDPQARELNALARVGSDSKGSELLTLPMVVDDQPMRSFGMLLDIEIPSGKAAVVTGRWRTADGALASGELCCLVRVSRAAPRHLDSSFFATFRDQSVAVVSDPMLQVFVAPHQLETEADWYLPSARQAGEPARVYRIWEGSNSPAIAELESAGYEMRRAGNWVLGVRPRKGKSGKNNEDEVPQLSKPVLAKAANAWLTLAPGAKDLFELSLPLSGSRPAIAYLIGADLAPLSVEVEVATDASVALPRMGAIERGVIAGAQLALGEQAVSGGSGWAEVAWPTGPIQTLESLEGVQLDRLGIERFGWRPTGRAGEQGLRMELGAPGTGQTTASLEFRF